MQVYVLLGPPGAGKGTVAPIIAEQTGLLHVSTGHIIRTLIRDANSDLGQRCAPFMERGDYVPDDMMLEIIQRVFLDRKEKNLLLDGFPRSVQQAEDLSELLRETKGEVAGVLLLEVDADVAVERCGHRRTCTGCGSVFHGIVRPPKVEGLCDTCGGPLALRDDDSPEMVRRRLEHFTDVVSGLAAHYEEQDILWRIDARVDVNEVVEQVIAHVKLDEQ